MTRADFYVGKGKDAEWLGSTNHDGYPDGISKSVLNSHNEKFYRQAVDEFLKADGNAIFPKDGWPWPWDNSKLTDFSYAFDEARVWVTPFGYGWFYAMEDIPEELDRDHDEVVEFPNMSSIRATPEEVLKKSGVITIRA